MMLKTCKIFQCLLWNKNIIRFYQTRTSSKFSKSFCKIIMHVLSSWVQFSKTTNADCPLRHSCLNIGEKTNTKHIKSLVHNSAPTYQIAISFNIHTNLWWKKIGCFFYSIIHYRWFSLTFPQEESRIQTSCTCILYTHLLNCLFLKATRWRAVLPCMKYLPDICLMENTYLKLNKHTCIVEKIHTYIFKHSISCF